VLNLIVFLGLGLGMFWLFVVLHTAWMLTHPPRRTYASAIARGKPGDPSELPRARDFRYWSLRSRGRELPVWDIAGERPEGPVVILTHGWGDSRIGALARLDAIASRASRVLAWDMPGHGDASGVCSLGSGEIDDLQVLIKEIKEPAPGAGIVLYGWSLGAGLSLVAAAQNDAIRGVIAETPYRLPRTPARNVIRARGLPHHLTLSPAFLLLRTLFGAALADRSFDRARWAAAVQCPVLVVHGDQDIISPVEDGREIAAAAPRGRLAVVRGAGHNNLWTDEGLAEECARAVRDFLDATPTPEPRPESAPSTS
jgi:pimeloyl-ACP methyl ester carboxylesterase